MNLNLYQISNIISLLGIVLAVIIFLYDRYIRRYIRVNIVRNVDTTKSNAKYYLIFSKKLGIKALTFNYKDKTYVIDLIGSINDQRNRPILYYELENLNPIYFVKIPETYKYNPTNLKRVLRENMLEKLLGTNKETVYTVIIIALIIGMIAISIYDNYRISQLNEKLIQLLNSTRPYY